MTAPAPNPIDDLSIEEVAVFLKVTTRTMHRWRAEGIGPPTLHVGGSIRYPVAALKEWLASRIVLNDNDPTRQGLLTATPVDQTQPQGEPA